MHICSHVHNAWVARVVDPQFYAEMCERTRSYKRKYKRINKIRGGEDTQAEKKKKKKKINWHDKDAHFSSKDSNIKAKWIRLKVLRDFMENNFKVRAELLSIQKHFPPAGRRNVLPSCWLGAQRHPAYATLHQVSSSHLQML